MRLTFLVAAAMVVAACGAVDETGAADAPDAGSMVAPQTGGSGGAGGTAGMAPDAGNAGVAGTGGGTGGRGGAGGGQSPDAMPAPPPADAQPMTGPPAACMVDRLLTFVCMDPPNTKGAKVLHKNGYVCDSCVTAKSDGTTDKTYVGCSPAAGEVCVMSCSECK